MLKKFLILTICTVTIWSTNVFAAPKDPKPHIRPLKIEEQKYKYGNIEKTLKKPDNGQFDSYATPQDEESRKTTSVLDVINTVMLAIFILLLIILLYTKIQDKTISEIFCSKKKNNKFNILSAQQLSDGKTLYLMEINGRQIIVGTTLSKVDSIMPLDKSYSTEEIPPEYIEKLFNDTSSEFKNLEE